MLIQPTTKIQHEFETLQECRANIEKLVMFGYPDALEQCAHQVRVSFNDEVRLTQLERLVRFVKMKYKLVYALKQ